VRFPFRALPAAGGSTHATRPVVDVWLEGLEATGLACLLDSGAMATRFSAELAEIAGIDLTAAPFETISVAGHTVGARVTRVTLSLRDATTRHDWDAAVWFCDPWPFGFQLLGLEGFFRHFRVKIAGYPEWVECEPEDGSAPLSHIATSRGARCSRP
jgi:hypothetical protein